MATNRLYRDTEHGMVAGVCAGIGNRMDVDPTLIRVAAVALAVVTAGTAILAYLALWIVMPPSEDASGMPSAGTMKTEFRDAGSRARDAAQILGRHARAAKDELSAMRRTADPSRADATEAGAGTPPLEPGAEGRTTPPLDPAHTTPDTQPAPPPVPPSTAGPTITPPQAPLAPDNAPPPEVPEEQRPREPQPPAWPPSQPPTYPGGEGEQIQH